MKRRPGEKKIYIRRGTTTGTLVRHADRRWAKKAALKRRWLFGAALFTALMIIVLAITLPTRGDEQTELPVTPTSSPSPLPESKESSLSESYTSAPPSATEAPEKTIVPRPSLVVTDKNSLISIFWWMLQSGEETVTLDRMTLSNEDLANYLNPLSNYITAYSYKASERRLRFVYKPGVRILQALENGTTDALEASEQAIALQARSVISAIIQPTMTDIERELAVHDYICSHCTYSLIGEGENITDARGFFEHGLLQCAGYVDTFRLLARLAGLDVEIIGGPTTRDAAGAKGHAWNLIQLDGLWYVVDLTWDDRLGGDSSVEHTFFNLPQSAFGATRTWDADYCPAGSYALNVDEKYYYATTDYLAASPEQGVDIVVRQLRDKNMAYVCFPGTDYAKEVTEALGAYGFSDTTCISLAEDLYFSLYKYTVK